MAFIYGDQTEFENGDFLHRLNDRWISRGHLAEGDLVGAAVNTFAFNWQNPHANPIIVTRLIVDVTTPGATPGALLDAGSAAGTGVHSDNLINGGAIDVAGVLDNFGDPGGNGKFKQRLDANGGATDWITGQILIQEAAALAGKFYIEYIEVI